MATRELQRHPSLGQRGKKCQVCGKMCSDDTSLDSHYSLLHPEMKLICLKCPNIVMFSSTSALKNHYSKHGSKVSESSPRNESNFGCGLCSHIAPTKERLGEHVKAAHSFHCRNKLCSFKTTSKEALDKHFSATHEFRCTAIKCSFIAETKDKLNAHINDAHMHRCELCSFRSPQENVLRIHVRKMHVERVRCDQCTMLVQKSELDTHKMTKHGAGNHGQESSSSDLKSGTRKLYPCPECHVNFSSLDAMKDHVKTRHKKQVEVIYKCPKNRCNYQTSNRLQMQKHQKDQHSSERSNVPVQVGPAKPIAFDCQFCDFTAKSMELLREHRSIHLQKPQEPEEEVDLDMEVTSEDVPLPTEMEHGKEGGTPATETEVTPGEDVSLPAETNQDKEEGTTTNEMEVTPCEDAGTPTEKNVAGEEMLPRIEKEVTKENEPSPVDLPPPIEKAVAGEDSSTPTETEGTKEDIAPIVEKNDTSQEAAHGDVPSLIEKEVIKEDAVKEVANEDALDSTKC